jgi:hypothetical protein
MNSEEIIEMARQAGLLGEVNGWDVWFPDELEAFAKLVAAKEREACAKEAETTFYSVQAAENIRARGEA